MKEILTIFVLIIGLNLNAQNHDFNYLQPGKVFDTLNYKSNKVEVSSFYLQNEFVLKKMKSIKLEMPDRIFSRETNDFSFLKISDRYNNEKIIPTIPLKYLIILDKDSLIVGLSDIVSSPYNLVIYNFQGELKSKLSLQSNYYQLDESNFEKLQKQFPKRFNCLKKDLHIFKHEGYYLIDFVTKCTIDFKSDGFNLSGFKLVNNPYFKKMEDPLIQNRPVFKSYFNMLSETDPFYELLLKNGKPEIIKLNDYEGNVICIPLQVQYLN